MNLRLLKRLNSFFASTGSRSALQRILPQKGLSRYGGYVTYSQCAGMTHNGYWRPTLL
jgi:hypothetical protein